LGNTWAPGLRWRGCYSFFIFFFFFFFPFLSEIHGHRLYDQGEEIIIFRRAQNQYCGSFQAGILKNTLLRIQWVKYTIWFLGSVVSNAFLMHEILDYFRENVKRVVLVRDNYVLQVKQ
jgi:hypothetical protein